MSVHDIVSVPCHNVMLPRVKAQALQAGPLESALQEASRPYLSDSRP